MQYPRRSGELDRQMLRSALEELYAARRALDRLLRDEAADPGIRNAIEAARTFLCCAITAAKEQLD